jgi:hypothetical protein
VTSPPVIPTDDYEAIEAAVMDTARGRWFLAEFARRNRTADTRILLDAIERLERQLALRPAEVAKSEPVPHEPVRSNAVVSSAGSELFAVEPEPHPHRVTIPAAGLADDGEASWIIEEPAFAPMPAAPRPPSLGGPGREAEPPAEIHEIHDAEDLIWPATAPVQTPAPEPAAVAAPPVTVVAATTPAPARLVPSPQSAMLASALEQAEQAVAAHAAEPEPLSVPGSGTPLAADPAELDALSFEEKSVYFA